LDSWIASSGSATISSTGPSVRPSPPFFWLFYLSSFHQRPAGGLPSKWLSTTTTQIHHNRQHSRCADAILILLIFLVFLLPNVEKHKPNFNFFSIFRLIPFLFFRCVLIVVQINQRTRRGAARGTVGL
jgi:hypothetical protein